MKTTETQKSKGPYFACGGSTLGYQVRMSYPAGEFGPAGSDFVETYSSRAAALRDAKAMNKEWAAKQPEAPPATVAAPEPIQEDPGSDAAWERHLDEKAAQDADPREEGSL